MTKIRYKRRRMCDQRRLGLGACAAWLLIASGCGAGSAPAPREAARTQDGSVPDGSERDDPGDRHDPFVPPIEAGALDPGDGAPDASRSHPASALTLGFFLRQMTDLGHLARLPDVPYTTQLVSSHNPRSDTALPGDPDWHADQDFLETEPDVTETLLEQGGPGVLTRIWSASPSGILRIYLDGADEPVVEAELAELLRGDIEPFLPPFAFVAAYGHNLYFPITFEDGCRVTLTGTTGGVVYYHLSFRSYPAGTAIERFGEDALSAAESVMAEVAAELDAPEPPALTGTDVLSFELDSARAQDAAAELSASEAGSVIRALRITPASRSPEALRGTALLIEMDGELTVRVPLLDFFALGLDAGEVQALPVMHDRQAALEARFPMPFALGARIWLERMRGSSLSATLDVEVATDVFDEQSLYLYAGFMPPQLELSKPAHDITLASAQGQGYYVGNTLNVGNPSAGWWGEGDERIYVDGESFPSHFGTGTEDYYGYAWCSNQLFSTPYIGQTLSSTHESYGLISLYRFQVLDPIPFTESLRFDLEVRHWGDPVEVSYDSVHFLYARPGASVSGLDADPAAFVLPVLEVGPPPGVGAGPYRCGG